MKGNDALRLNACIALLTLSMVVVRVGDRVRVGVRVWV